MNPDNLKKQLRIDEGCSTAAYQDHLGYWTIGVGHLIDRRKGGSISDLVIDAILTEDVNKAVWALDRSIPWWRDLTDDRQDALVNMCFNLGITGLLGFHHFLGSLKDGNLEEAARQLESSLWATQVGDRAKRIAKVIRGEP